MTFEELVHLNGLADGGAEVRVGDVSEGDDLHCSVGRVVLRGGCVIVVPGDDKIWREEQLASEVTSETLWETGQ